MMWSISFYQRANGNIPVKEFIESLPPKHGAKAYWEITLLEEHGSSLPSSYVKAIQGERYKGLWELRISYGSDISRIFYFLPVGNQCILLHGFVKKTGKTPKVELETAKRYMEDYLRRCMEDE
jgi:phage-related protein